jgi:hypothetical protein
MELIYFVLIPLIGIAIIGVALGVKSKAPEQYKRELFSDTQRRFTLTIEPALDNLEKAADKLWLAPNSVNFIMFLEQLRNTEETMMNNHLLLEPADLMDLQTLLNDFWQFQAGKKRLIEYKMRKTTLSDTQQYWPVNVFIAEKAQTRQQLIKKIAETDENIKR